MEKRQFEIEGKNVEVYSSAEQDRPVVYLNTCGKECEGICRRVGDLTGMEFSLVTIGNLDWNGDMSPWAIPPVSRDGAPCTGGADGYLHILVDEILPAAERYIRGIPRWRAIAGYSLGGLFALYSLYHTGVFSRAASISGSLWFPNIREYIYSHDFIRTPDCIYFSLGDRERNTGNPFLRPVQDNTEQIREYYAQKGIDSIFVLNKGNHFQNAASRTEQGIRWMLEK